MLHLPEGNVKVADLNATQGSLLGFLHDGPMTGWDLLQAVEGGLARFWSITPSHVYRELRVLEDRGLVVAGEPGVRDRVPFSLTPAGREAFAGWVRHPPGAEQIRFPLLLTLWFGRHLDPAILTEFVEESREEHERRRALYETLEPTVGIDDPNRRAVLRFGIAYERAVVGWLDELCATPSADRPSRGATLPRGTDPAR
jgi:DNA-binding PadR family transcriptional regulator